MVVGVQEGATAKNMLFMVEESHVTCLLNPHTAALLSEDFTSVRFKGRWTFLAPVSASESFRF